MLRCLPLRASTSRVSSTTLSRYLASRMANAYVTAFRIDSTRRLRVFFLCAAIVVVLACGDGVGATTATAFSSAARDDDDDYDARDRGQPYQPADDHRENGEESMENGSESTDGDHRASRLVSDEHEIPRQAAVKVRIRGDLATPAPEAGIELGFVPKQTYYQVRRYDTRLHLPRSAAIDEAETAEELANAPRLREVVSHTKTQQVYEEQGYEDAAYDHAGYKKAAQRHENTRVDFPVTAAKYADDSSGPAQIDDRSMELVPSDNRTDRLVGDTSSNGFGDDDGDSEDNNNENSDARKTIKKTSDAVAAAMVDEPSFHKRTKVRAGTRSRQKAKHNVKVEKNDSKTSQDQPYHWSSAASASTTATAKATPPTTSSISYIKRRKTKDNSTTTGAAISDESDGGAIKMAQESKTIPSKLKVKETREEQQQQQPRRQHNNRQLVTPTTYRPSTLPETLTRLRTAAVKRKPALAKSSTRDEERAAAAAASTAPITGSFAKNMLIDSSGYVFENPFSNAQNSHEIETLVKPFAALRSKSKINGIGVGGGEYAVNERQNENHQTRPYDKAWRSKMQQAKVVGDATSLYTKSKFSRLKANAQTFPYKIVDVNAKANANTNTYDTSKKWGKEAVAFDVPYKIKTDFPYKIVTSDAMSSSQATASTLGSAASGRKRFKFYTPPSKKDTSSSYTAEDDSPWIPITPKEAYDIHGYAAATVRRQNITGSDRSGGAPQISVTELPVDDLTAQRPRDAFVKRRRKMDPIRVASLSLSQTSSTLAPISKRSRSPHNIVSTSYSIRHEYDSPANADSGDHLLSISLSDGWLDRPSRRHRFNSWDTSTSSIAPSYSYLPPQIDQSFDSQQKLFDDAIVNTRSQSQSKRQPTSSVENQNAPIDEQSHRSNDIETLSSNRYAVFQRFEHTTLPMQKLATHSEDDHQHGDRENLLQYRHPYLTRETSHLQRITSLGPRRHQHHYEQERPLQPSHNFTWKKSEFFDGGGSIDDQHIAVGGGTNATSPTSTTAATMTTTTSGRRNLTQYWRNNSTSEPTTASTESKFAQRLDKIIVYPVDYASSASFVENLTLAHYADPLNTVFTSLPLNYRDRLHALRDHFVSNQTTGNDRVENGDDGDGDDNISGSRRKIRSAANQQLLGVYMDGSTTEITVDVDKYPFYKYESASGGNSLAKYSVLRYVSNPNTVPTKKAGQMNFYQSTNHVQCPEPDAPLEVAPPRQRDGQWIGDANSETKGKPRVRNVGLSIRCHKIKFFGYDPLDNPFFQEQSIGFPEVFRSIDANDAADDATTANANTKRRRSKSISATTKGDDDSDAPSSNDDRRNRHRKLVTKRAAKLGTGDDVYAGASKKMVRKTYLVGGFIDIRRENDVKVHNETSSNPEAITNLPETTTSDATFFSHPKIIEDLSTMTTTTAATASLSISTEYVKNVNPTTLAGGTDTRTRALSAETVINNGNRSMVARDLIGSTSAVHALSTSNSGNSNNLVNNVEANLSPFKPKYKEPSWRRRNHRYDEHAIVHALKSKLSTTDYLRHFPTLDVGVNGTGGVDSLLYVIHPESGRGKWMKIVKVERLAHRVGGVNSTIDDEQREQEMPLPSESTTSAAKAEGVGHRFASNNELTLHRHSCKDNLAYAFERRQRQRSSSEMTQRDRSHAKQTITPNGKHGGTEVETGSNNYDDIRHISGLLRQVAPLKASQAEINNLQTTEERLEEDAVVDADVAIDDVNDNDNFKVNGDSEIGVVPVTTAMAIQARYKNRNRDRDNVHAQFPQPHERLYYYVVDE